MQVMTDTLELQARANSQAQLLIGGLRPDHIELPTPCREWNVRTLLNHLIALHRSAAAAITGGEDVDWGADYVGDDPRAAFSDAAEASAVAFRAPGVLDKSFQMPWGESTGDALSGMLAMDTVIHSWDLAKATGETASLDPDLCETVLAAGQQMMKPEYRTPESGFGPEIAVPVDAPACDRMAGYFGRQP